MANLKEVGNSLKKKYERYRQTKESYSLAKQSIFHIAKEEQTSSRTYFANTESVFDLRQEASGTIFRVKSEISGFFGTEKKVGVIHFWFVIGDSHKNIPDLFLVTHKDSAEATYATGEQLKLGKSLHLKRLDLSDKPTAFPICQVCDTLLKDAVYIPFFAEKLEPERLDVMFNREVPTKGKRVSNTLFLRPSINASLSLPANS
jgi:hypothetical protein